jgi:hypothetical protein
VLRVISYELEKEEETRTWFRGQNFFFIHSLF